MSLLATKYFGSVSVEATDLYSFPLGLPGFEDEKSFVLMEVPDRRPLLLLQSANCEHLCFPALPILTIDPEYALAVSFEDLQTLELEPAHQPGIGQDVMVISLLSRTEGNPVTANLMAPVVIHLEKHLALQAIRSDFRYSHQSPVLNPSSEQAC